MRTEAGVVNIPWERNFYDIMGNEILVMIPKKLKNFWN